MVYQKLIKLIVSKQDTDWVITSLLRQLEKNKMMELMDDDMIVFLVKNYEVIDIVLQIMDNCGDHEIREKFVNAMIEHCEWYSSEEYTHRVNKQKILTILEKESEQDLIERFTTGTMQIVD